MARHSFDSIEHLKQWAGTTCPLRRLLPLASIAFGGFIALISALLLHIPDTNFYHRIRRVDRQQIKRLGLF